MIQRIEYLNWLKSWQGQQIVKVVSGVRRCGKSTLFDLFRQYLRESGVSEDRIVSLNFEDLDYEYLSDYRALYDHVRDRLVEGQMTYVFLDEIQHVEHFEKAVDSLFIRENVDVYITGSNAYFMSGELATVLTGRYVELRMLPLSFSEFCQAADSDLSRAQLFNRYVTSGSFPYVSRFRLDDLDARTYLVDIYRSVLLKDVVARLGVSDVTTLENITRFLLQNVGSKVSLKKIGDTLKSAGTGVDQKTVSRYVRGLVDSLLLYEAPRYNVKGRQLLTTQPKYYAVDLGLRHALVKGSASDVGHILENVIYLELLRRGYQVYVGALPEGEVDFVAIRNGQTEYYQVSATVLQEDTLRRELGAFDRIQDNYPKYLLTLDELFPEADYDGVQKLNALDWLLNSPAVG